MLTCPWPLPYKMYLQSQYIIHALLSYTSCHLYLLAWRVWVCGSVANFNILPPQGTKMQRLQLEVPLQRPARDANIFNYVKLRQQHTGLPPVSAARKKRWQFLHGFPLSEPYFPHISRSHPSLPLLLCLVGRGRRSCSCADTYGCRAHLPQLGGASFTYGSVFI